ncbi:MAG: DUF4386 domain-containing protein [Gammaproteobacteria bacterium]
MTDTGGTTSPLAWARWAGLLYLAIITFGLFGELFVRSALIVHGDAAATAGNIANAPGLFRAGFLADSVMVLSDVALAVLLYILLRPVSRVVALMAMCFRLAQSAVLALNLLNYHAAGMLLDGSGHGAGFGTGQRDALAYFFLDLHTNGYDLGLLLFGIHCLLLGYLIYRAGYLPRLLGVLVSAAGFAYLIGGYTRFLFPDYVAAVSPVYIVAIVSEVSLCLWLLIKGVDMRQWERLTGSSAAVI